MLKSIQYPLKMSPLKKITEKRSMHFSPHNNVETGKTTGSDPVVQGGSSHLGDLSSNHSIAN